MIEQEHRIKETQPLLQYATGDIQISSASRFITVVESYVEEPDKLKFISQAKSFLAEKDILPETAVRMAISCFDYCLSEEIRKYAGDIVHFTDPAAVYFRSDVYKTIFPEVILHTITTHLGYEPQEIMIAAPAHIEGYEFTFGESGMFTPDLAFWVNKDQSRKPEPPCGIARQEVFRSLLKCGVNPIQVNRELAINPANKPETFYQRKYRRKALAGLMAEEETLRLWQTRTEKHWGILLGDNGGSAVLFSSGTSSNEAVMLSLQSIGARAYVHQNWYYENNKTADNIFKERVEEVTQADILLVNFEPTNYFRLDGVEENSLESIKEFVVSAIVDPERRKYLVIDSTVNPLFTLREFGFDEIPPNLVLIKTVSVTKHQDGGRNYFFGAVWTGNRELATRIEELKGKVGGDLHESHIIHFPRPTAESLRNKRRKVAEANRTLTLNMNGKGEWNIVPYSYHSFIFPPQSLVDRIVQTGKTNLTDELDIVVKAINDQLFGIIASTVEEFGDAQIEMGDSFGLPQTRISIQGGFNTIDGVTFRLKIPRICPGYKTDISQNNEFLKKLICKLDMLII